MPRIGPLDKSRYDPCCGEKPKFWLAPDVHIWWAKCMVCGYVACALDGSADGLAGAWNEAMRKKEEGK